MIVGLIGGSRAGKSTCAKYMAKHGNFIMFGFVDPIRRFLFQLIPEAQDNIFGSSKFREVELPTGVTVRSTMDEIGNAVRKAKPSAFVDFAIDSARIALDANVATGVVFHDTRKLIEVDAIKNAGGVILRLTRGEKSSLLDDELDDYPADVFINNRDMTLVEMELATIRTMAMLRRSEPKG